MDLTTFGFREDFDPDNRFIKQEEIILNDNNNYFVSTVDLGLNHRYGEGEPLYCETMIFRIEDNGEVNFNPLYCNRYTTKEVALKEHDKLIKKLQEGLYEFDEHDINIL